MLGGVLNRAIQEEQLRNLGSHRGTGRRLGDVGFVDHLEKRVGAFCVEGNQASPERPSLRQKVDDAVNFDLRHNYLGSVCVGVFNGQFLLVRQQNCAREAAFHSDANIVDRDCFVSKCGESLGVRRCRPTVRRIVVQQVDGQSVGIGLAVKDRLHSQRGIGRDRRIFTARCPTAGLAGIIGGSREH